MARYGDRTGGKRTMSHMLPVTNIQRFSIHDGPGIRTTVFLKGCHLNCAWCHNPETQRQDFEILYTSNNCIGCGACISSCPTGAHLTNDDDGHVFELMLCNRCMLCVDACPSGAIDAAGKMMSLQEIKDVVMRDKAFYGTVGGITLSGGEPLLHTDGCMALLQWAKEVGITTVVQTSGFFDMQEADMEKLAELTDVFLWDFKDGNSARHERYTGKSNEKIKDNLHRIDKIFDKIKLDKRIILRCIMVKKVNMDATNFTAIAETYKSLNSCTEVELVPYHALGGAKNKQLGHTDNGRKDWIPSSDDLDAAREALRHLGCDAIV